MTDPPTFDAARLRADLSEAQAALHAFAEGPAREAADAVGARFAEAGERIARSLSRAAADGQVSLKELAKAILEELARIALPALTDRIAGATLPFFGARAGGGPVAAGGAYLVGERGPELFTPRGAGLVSPAQTAPVSITIAVSPGADADSFLRHRGQIAAEIARAVAYGRRNL